MHRLKKSLSVLLAAAMLSSLLPFAAGAAEMAVPDAETTVSEDMPRVGEQPEDQAPGGEAEISPMSLLPLEERYASLDLTGYTPIELKQVKVSTILSGLNPAQDIDAEAAVVWAKGYGSDDFSIVSQEDTIDLLPDYFGNTSLPLELIVGTANQLDGDNIRYIVSVELSNLEEWLNCEIDTQEETQRTPIEIYNKSWYHFTNGGYQFDIDMASTDKPVCVGLSFGAAFQNKNLSVSVFAKDTDTGEYTSDITNQIWDQSMANVDAGYPLEPNPYDYGYFNVPLLLELKQDEVSIGSLEFQLFGSNRKGDVNSFSLYAQSESRRDSVRSGTHYGYQDDVQTITMTLRGGYPADAEYYLGLDYYYHGTSAGGAEHVTKAVLGHCDTLEQAAGQADIKDQLFPVRNWERDAGYQANYSGGVDFTVFGDEGEVIKLTVITVDAGESETDIPDPASGDTYFQFQGAVGAANQYVVPYEHDTYYSNGFQTVLTTDDVDLAHLKGVFWVNEDSNIHVYADGKPQVSETTEQDFTGGVVQYAAAAEDGASLKNYWVTYVKKHTDGAKLFVNGINGPDGAKREIFLNSLYDNQHEVFIANVGDAELTGLSVTLDAANIKLDDYWRVGGEGNSTLAPFTATQGTTDRGELPNVAKIRLLPDGEGAISGTLTIAADGQEPVVLTLSGIAGDPKITTETIPQAVKYVPYGALVQTSNMYDWNKITFSLTGGRLPAGMILKENGEIYGVPRETGSFPITVRADNSYSEFKASTASFTLVVNENTDDNVNAATDEGYEITTRVPETVRSYSDQVFKAEGVLAEFQDFWLDGVKLSKDRDYTAESGSTKITIKAQTFKNAGSGKHTISAEFRVNGDENLELKRASQNYTQSGGNQSGNDSTPGGGGTAVFLPPVTPPALFKDVAQSVWYYSDVKWAKETGLMVGVGDGLFAPDLKVSQGTVVTVLARLGKADLSTYTGAAWYDKAAAWATEAGIVNGGLFSGDVPSTRGELAVMLVRYLDAFRIPHDAGSEVAFADMGQMTEEELAAFRTLYAAGIFKGRDGNRMEAQGVATRAELAVLLHRLSGVTGGV